MKEIYRDSIKALFFILLMTMINLYIPILSLLVYIVWPIPIVFLIVKYGIKQATIVIIAAALINGLLLGATMGLYTVIGFGLIGFILGTGLLEGLSPLKTLLLTILAVLISNILIAGVFSYILDFNYSQLLQDILTSLQNSSQFADMSTLFDEQVQAIIQLIFPSLLIITSIITGILTYYGAHWYLRRTGMEKESYQGVKYWRFPRWPLSLGIIVSLLLKTNVVLANANIVFIFLLFLQGFAVGLYYISGTKSQFLYFAYIFLIFIFNFFSFVILALIGLIDLWFDLRRLERG